MKKIFKLPKIVLIITMLFTNLFGNGIPVSAATYQPISLGDIAGTGAEVKLGYNTAWWRNGIGKISVDGEIAFCIEPTTLGLGGSYSKNDDIPADLQVSLARIVYYGWDITSKTDDDYATTQYMIWESMGASITQWYGGFGSRYPQLKAEVQQKINNHKLTPLFPDGTHEVELGSSITLTDSRGVLNSFHVNSNGGASVTINGNNLVITPNENTPENLTITLQKENSGSVGSSIAYRSGADNGQDVGVFKVKDPFKVNLRIKVLKYGNLNIGKQDEDGTYVPNTSFNLSYNADMSTPLGTYTTGADGTVLIEKLLPKKVYVQEVAVPEPLILDSTIREVTVIPNETISYNASNIYKTGNLEIQKLDADTGKPVNTTGAEFAIYKSDGTYVNTITTNDKGIASLTGIRWGDYYYVETKAPNFYVLNGEQVPFQIRENGVTIKKSLSNKRTLGTIQLEKLDKETGKTAQGDATLNGAVYELIAKENILSPDDHHVIYNAGDVVSTMTIDKGTAKVENLYLGKYTIKEKTPSKGYLLDESAHEINLNYTDQTKTVEIRDVISNEQVMKRAFQIIKISSDGESGTTPVIKGAQFTVKLESEVAKVGWDKARTYDVLTTDDKGFAQSVELPFGNYRVRETVIPNNHEGVADFFVNVKDDSREPIKWTIQNDVPYKTYIGVVKIDSETGDIVRLEGATWKIKNLDTDEYVGFWVYGSPTVKWVDEFTTNEDGNLITPDSVRAGHYQLEEIKSPEGMLLNRTSKPFTISDDGAHQVGPDGHSYITTIQFANAPAKGRLVLEKTAELFMGYEETETEYGTLYEPKYEEGLLSGVTYEIKAREDILSADGTRVYYHKGDLVETLKTDGLSATMSSLLPLGQYTVQEIACDDDQYVIDSNVYEFDLIYKDQVTEVVYQTMKPFNEQQTASGTITKDIEESDVIDNSEAYENIKFGVYTAEDLVINGTKALNKDSLIQVVSLEDTLSGNIKVDFAGDYYVKEITTDDQYVLSDEKYPFNFAYAGDKETIIEINGGKPIKNKVKCGNISVLKRDADTDKPLAGAIFEFSRDEDFENILATVTSDNDGIALLENVEKSTVYVREATSPSGYTINKKVEKAEITENGQLVEFEYENTAYRGNIHIYKTDKETKDNLSGIQYRVTAAEDIYEIGHPVDDEGNKIIKYHKGDPVSVDISEDGYYMTNELGEIHLADLPMGTYSVIETKTLDGYVLDPLEHIVTLTPESDTVALVEKDLVVDNDFTKVDIEKVDIETKEGLIGASMELINKDTNEVVKSWLSTGKPMHFDRLPVANYILHEKSAPKGYLVADDIEFTVEARTDLQVITMQDDFTKVEFEKLHAETKEFLPDAKLELYRYDEDNKKELIEEWTTQDVAHLIQRLPVGRYLLHEEEAPTGFHEANDIEFEVKAVGEVQKITMVDEKIYSFIKIKKVDAEDHEKVLAGAEFTMYSDEACTQELAKVISGEDGIALFDHLEFQTVFIKETKAPEGYHLSEDMAVININEDWVDEDNEKTIIWADHIIEIVNTGMQSNDYLVGMLFTSLAVMAIIAKRKRKMNKK